MWAQHFMSAVCWLCNGVLLIAWWDWCECECEKRKEVRVEESTCASEDMLNSAVSWPGVSREPLVTLGGLTESHRVVTPHRKPTTAPFR